VTSRWTIHRRGDVGRRAVVAGPSAEVRTVLLTGATGFLGATVAAGVAGAMDVVGGKVICWCGPSPTRMARVRLDKTFDSGDPELLRHYRELAASIWRSCAGDKGEANLGPAISSLAAGWPTRSI